MYEYRQLDQKRIDRLMQHAEFIESNKKKGKRLELTTQEDLKFFAGYDLTGYNLRGVNFEDLDCRSCNFTKCDLTGTEFIWTHFDEHTLFTDAILDKAYFYEPYGDFFLCSEALSNVVYVE